MTPMQCTILCYEYQMVPNFMQI